MEALARSHFLVRFLVTLVVFIVIGVLFEAALTRQVGRLNELFEERDRLAGLVQQRVGAGAQAETTEQALRMIEGKLGAPLTTIQAALERKLSASDRDQVTGIMQRVAQSERAVLFLEPGEQNTLNGEWQGSLESFSLLLRALTEAEFVGQLDRLTISALATPGSTTTKTPPLYRFTFVVSLP